MAILADKGGSKGTRNTGSTQPAYAKSGYNPQGAKLQTAATQLRAPLTKASAPAPAPTQYSAPAPTLYSAQSFDSGGDYGGGGGGYAAPQVNPDTEYLQEAGYLASISALDQALQNFNTQDTTERGRYDLDFDKGLRDLGFKDSTPDVTTDNLGDVVNGAEDWGNRAWDWNDMLTASGRGYQNNINDFAGRGMAQSQAYFDSLKNLERSLDDQRGAIGTARQNFRSERDAAKTNYTVQDTAARNTAKVDAITRLQQSLGLI